MTDLVGDGWYQDLDISGEESTQGMIQEAQAWLDDQGYSVQVLNVKVNDDDCDWFIEGNFNNPNFAKKGMPEDAEPMDREWALVKKLGRLGQRIVQNPKLWDRYDQAVDNDDIDWIIGLIQDGTGATVSEVTKLADLFGEIGGGLGRLTDFAWAVKEGTWDEDFMNPYRAHRSQDLNEFSFDKDGGDDDGGDDPYKYPQPEHYSRSIDFFGQFEADHFDDEVFDKATGEFRGYWDDQEGRDQIAYFKFDNPQRTGDDDPGMGWYYEPQNESAAGDDQLNEILPALAAGAGALARGAAAAGRMAAPTLRKVPGAVKTVGQAISRVPGAVEKVAIQGLELLNDKVPGGIFNPDGSLKGSQYLTKYLSPQEIQQVQQHQQQGMTEGNNDDYGPELDALKKEFGKFTTHYDRMEKDPAYAARYNKQQTDQQNRDMPNDAEDDYDAEDDFMSDRTHNMAEGQQMGEYGRVLSALGLYVPDKFSMEELNTPDWHRVIASKADVPVEYAGKVIDDFTRPVDGHDDDEWPEDDNENVTEGKPKEKEADYGPDYQDMVARVKKLAGLGPLKTVYDPQKRVYRNVPTAVQPKKEQR
jgi:hypothetical protein